jgi:preprotein translocase YajC subunit
MYLSNVLAKSWGSTLLLVGLIAILVLFMVMNGRSTKKRQQEQQRLLDAIRPGNKVKTIGGICGIVVEICPEDNTFILETGSDATGKSYIKFDKQSVYQTDAVVENAVKKAEVPEEAIKDEQEEKSVDENTFKE